MDAADTMRTGDDALRGAVATCQTDGRVLDGLSAIFRDVDGAVRLAGSVCMGGGGCCRFALAGHRLYVSSAELALLQNGPPVGSAGPLVCPWQQGPACSARERRPLGCRTFFCRMDPRLVAELYESAHARIRRLHEVNAVPYIYVEMTAALEQLRR